jgi:hypothetical protein
MSPPKKLAYSSAFAALADGCSATTKPSWIVSSSGFAVTASLMVGSSASGVIGKPGERVSPVM